MNLKISQELDFGYDWFVHFLHPLVHRLQYFRFWVEMEIVKFLKECEIGTLNDFLLKRCALSTDYVAFLELHFVTLIYCVNEMNDYGSFENEFLISIDDWNVNGWKNTKTARFKNYKIIKIIISQNENLRLSRFSESSINLSFLPLTSFPWSLSSARSRSSLVRKQTTLNKKKMKNQIKFASGQQISKIQDSFKRNTLH